MTDTTLETEEIVERVENLIVHYQKALLIKPDSAVIHNELGKLYAFQGKVENPPYHYLRSIQVAPDYFQAYWNLKFALLSLSWYGKTIAPELLDQGIEILRSAAQNQPDFPFAYAVLGDLLTQKGSKQEAIHCYQMASRNQVLLTRPELARQFHNHNQKSQPDFLIMGFMRCGTTSLYEYLIAHPQVLPAIDKELWFFTNWFELGIDWYLAHFPSIANGRDYLTGEATPMYINFPDAATRILERFPAMKFIVLLRNPVERAISAISLNKPPGLKNLKLERNIINGLEKAESIVDSFTDDDLIKLPLVMSFDLDYPSLLAFSHILNSLYIIYLKKWLAIFPEDQFLILKSEDLFQEPATTISKVHSFLKLPDYQLSQYPNSNPGTYPSVSNSLRRRLAEFYQPYNQQLEEYLDMKFNWE